ncbi:ribokinase-like isoform X3 [Punica granatum]|uniref:Ribokinase-like isoform X3 n=1 Tax=Punica granatum TaxID=22663 RepID=A0A6P8E799_PUNGR|nr:ribokinase-like isoform X3 [Punica granatum]
MASHSLPPLPKQRIIVGFGGTCLDYLAVVANFPKPDDKCRSRSMKMQGGGDAANTLTCAARLDLNPRLISKIADDMPGSSILRELEADGVDTSFLVVAKEGVTPFSYVIVDQKTNTRTCIFTPGHPPLQPDDLSPSNLEDAMRGASVVYFDGRLTYTAAFVAREAARRNIPILLDAEKKREGLYDILVLARYAVCAAKFPQAWTEAPTIGSALVSMLLRLPKLKFVIVTLGAMGCIMLERIDTEQPPTEEVDVDSLLRSLEQRKDNTVTAPICISSEVVSMRAEGIGTVHGKLFLGTAEKIPPSELIDTTGAGDAFIGAVLYGLCAEMPPEKMLPFAAKVVSRLPFAFSCAKVAASCCRALGARTGLPQRTDLCLAPFLQDGCIHNTTKCASNISD